MVIIAVKLGAPMDDGCRRIVERGVEKLKMGRWRQERGRRERAVEGKGVILRDEGNEEIAAGAAR